MATPGARRAKPLGGATPLGAWRDARRAQRQRLRRLSDRAAVALRIHGRALHARPLFDADGRALGTAQPLDGYLGPASELPGDLAALWATDEAFHVRLGRRQQAALSAIIAARALELRRAKTKYYEGRSRAPS